MQRHSLWYGNYDQEATIRLLLATLATKVANAMWSVKPWQLLYHVRTVLFDILDCRVPTFAARLADGNLPNHSFSVGRLCVQDFNGTQQRRLLSKPNQTKALSIPQTPLL